MIDFKTAAVVGFIFKSCIFHSQEDTPNGTELKVLRPKSFGCIPHIQLAVPMNDNKKRNILKSSLAESHPFWSSQF